jgi:hypothetical protein
MTAVAALSGRRIDPADSTTARFPLENTDAVFRALLERFKSRGVTVLVSSAACGADLLGLEAARELGLRRVVVLPFSPTKFRQVSVIDRPGGVDRWGPAFDRQLTEIAGKDPRDLIVLATADTSNSSAYSATNERILEKAMEIAKTSKSEPVAIVVWDGAPRPGDDLTAHFAKSARERGVSVVEIPTL